MTPRIIFVVGTLEVGGSESKVVNIANGLVRNGHRAEIAYLEPPETLLSKIDSRVPVTNLRRHGKYSVSSLRRLQRLLDTGDIVVAVNFYPLLYVVPAARLGSAKRIRSACLVNATDIVDGQWIFEKIYSPLLRRCDRLVFGCAAQMKRWITRYRLRADNSTVIYNGVDEARFGPPDEQGGSLETRREFGIAPEAFVIGSVGRLVAEKNLHLLLSAFAEFSAGASDARLMIVGKGPELAALQEDAERLDIRGRVIFLGQVSDVRPALSVMDVFVLPSRAEVFANAALEAMSMSCPTILTDVGGAAEMIADGESGLLFDGGDKAELARLLAHIYSSESLRRDLGEGARRRVLERFRFDQMLDRYRVELSR